MNNTTEEPKKLIRIDPEQGIEIIDEDLYKKVKKCNLSPSMANSFLNCPADWFLDKYILPKIEHTEPIFFARGTAFHKVMEHFFTESPEERNPKNLAQLTRDTLVNEYPDLVNDPENINWIKNAINGYLSMGFNYKEDLIPEININNKPTIGLEFFVTGKFDTKRPIVGYVDKLANENSKLVMQDWKTGAKVHNYDPSKPISASNSFDYPRQQTLYAMLLEKINIELTDASLIFPVAKKVVEVDFKNDVIRNQAVSDMQKLDERVNHCIEKNFFPFTPALFCTWCHLLYSGRTIGRNRPPEININEFNQLVEYTD
jgi:RecB family exonuclease